MSASTFSFSPRPWSPKTPQAMGDNTGDFTVVENEITTNLALTINGAAAFASGIYPWFNVKDVAYGAVGDGSTDDASAIQSAIDAAEAANGGIVYFPDGNYIIGTMLTVQRGEMHLVGSGKETCTLKMADSADLVSLIHFGPDFLITETTGFEHTSLRSMKLDGNKANQASGTSVLRVFNIRLSVFEDLFIRDGFGIAILVEGRKDATVANCRENYYHNIATQANRGGGLHMLGGKQDRLDSLYSTSDGDAESNTSAHGFLFDNWDPGSDILAEMTQCVFSNIISTGAGGDAMRIGGVAKGSFSNITLLAAGQNGLTFKDGVAFSSGNAPSGDGSDALGLHFSNLTIRNPENHCIETTENSLVAQSTFVGLWLNMSNSSVSSHAMLLRAVRTTTFSSVHVQFAVDSVIVLQNGTPLGSAAESRFLTFDSVRSFDHGGAGSSDNSGDNHGFDIQDASRDITISGADFEGSKTSVAGGGFELNAAATVKRIQVNGGKWKSADTERSFKVASGAEDEVTVNGIVNQELDAKYVPSVASAATPDMSTVFGSALIDITGTLDITALEARPAGTVYMFRFNDTAGTTGVVNGNNLQLTGNFAYSALDILTVICDGTDWHEMSRSANV